MKRNYRNNKKQLPAQQKTGSILLSVARILLGLVFVFSGFVKAIDPLGFTYKIEDYLRAFGGVFEQFSVIAFGVAVALSTLELLIGLNLIFKVKLKLSIVLALLFMAVMTPLTLYIALKNPVSDCGCFGDALVISNWATFYKNIALSTLAVLLLVFYNRILPLFVAKIQTILFVCFIGVGVSLSVYCYLHLPIIDFRPYKIGVNIPNAMLVPQDAIQDKYSTTFIYKKNGVEKEFTLENYPKGDSTWVFVDQKSVLITKGYQPPIHDFSIVNSAYVDITEDVLSKPGYTFLLAMYDISKASEEGAKKAEVIYQTSLKTGTAFYALTASSDDEVKAFKKKTGVTFPFCKTDPIALKTMVRANPGLVLLKKGTVVGNWNWRDFLPE
jgi:uncharacterized membrane protein YphA (DoxX/SURF4 family)